MTVARAAAGAVATAGALILVGCAASAPDPVLDDSARMRLYDRADGAFARAHLLKPSAGREGRFFDLAPLLMLEAADGDEGVPAWPSRPDVEDGPPTVFFERTETASDREILEQWADQFNLELALVENDSAWLAHLRQSGRWRLVEATGAVTLFERTTVNNMPSLVGSQSEAQGDSP